MNLCIESENPATVSDVFNLVYDYSEANNDWYCDGKEEACCDIYFRFHKQDRIFLQQRFLYRNHQMFMISQHPELYTMSRKGSGEIETA